MSSHSIGHFGRVLAMLSATATLLCAFGTLAVAQEQPAPKWELYGGYSFWYPGADVHGVLPTGLVPVTSRLDSNPRGAGASVTYDFTRHFGLTVDASDHWGISEKGIPGACCRDADLSTLSIGPKFTLRYSHFAPFLEVLGGDQRLYPEGFHHIDKLGLMAGGGLDVNITRHFALRPIRADFLTSSYRYGPSASTPTTVLTGVRLQTGIVFMFGGTPVVPTSAICSVQPTEVFPGEPVTATAGGSNFKPKRTVRYEWSGSGVKVSGSSASTQIDTNGLLPGTYQIMANLSDGSRRGVATCNARFIVKQPNPPSIACSASPATLQTGGTSTISSTASSPDGRSLTYSYAASAGSITGNTSTAVLSTSGAPLGTITVTCNAADDRNPPLAASFTTTVNVQAPPPPPTVEASAIEKRLALHSIYFATAKPTPEHPDGGLLASQEKTLITLARDFQTYLQGKPDARLILEGHADPRGSAEYNQALSERRVDRTKRFLVEHAVPATSIQTEAFGKQHNLTDAEVKSAVEQNPELNRGDRQKLLDHMNTIVLASNRRVDIVLSNAGQKPQESFREYPFNAADSLTLLDTSETNKPAHSPAKKRSATKKR